MTFIKVDGPFKLCGLKNLDNPLTLYKEVESDRKRNKLKRYGRMASSYIKELRDMISRSVFVSMISIKSDE